MGQHVSLLTIKNTRKAVEIWKWFQKIPTFLPYSIRSWNFLVGSNWNYEEFYLVTAKSSSMAMAPLVPPALLFNISIGWYQFLNSLRMQHRTEHYIQSCYQSNFNVNISKISLSTWYIVKLCPIFWQPLKSSQDALRIWNENSEYINEPYAGSESIHQKTKILHGILD